VGAEFFADRQTDGLTDMRELTVLFTTLHMRLTTARNWWKN